MDREHSIAGLLQGSDDQREMNRNHGIRDEYAWMASFYDAVTLPFLLSARRRICRIAMDHGCRNVLDLCCGTGQQSIIFHRMGISATGVDISPSMLAVARKKSPPGTTFIMEDASSLPFPSASFDAAVLSLSLHEMEEGNRARILTEVGRILSSEGILIVLDYIHPTSTSSKMAFTLVNLVETLVGTRHHTNFLDFMRRGATEGCLSRHHLRVLDIEPHVLGTMGIHIATPGDSPSGGDPRSRFRVGIDSHHGPDGEMIRRHPAER